MPQFKVSNYCIFPAATSITNTFVSKQLDCIKNIKQELNKLNSEDVFAGPIAENIHEGASTVNYNLAAEVNKLFSTPNFIGFVESNYKESDDTTSKEMGGIVS